MLSRRIDNLPTQDKPTNFSSYSHHHRANFKKLYKIHTKMSLKIFSVSVTLVLISFQVQAQTPKVDCIDTMNDLEMYKWLSVGGAKLEYAETGLDLPGELSGTLEADGIIYINSTSGEGQGVSKQTFHMSQESAPYFLYIRYYGHEVSNNTENKQIRVMKGGVAGAQTMIPLTSGFVWGEALVELDPIFIIGEVIGVWAWFFDAGDFLLIDKLILTQGYDGLSIDDVKNLCFN